jgi:hypothetical protein
VAGGTSSTLVAGAVGNYQCHVTAGNQAGLAPAQTSARHGVFAIGKAKLNRRKGTATLPVTVPPEGVLALSGKGVVAQSRNRAGTVKLSIKATGKSRKRLNKRGRVKLRLKVAFTPNGGAVGGQEKTIRLRKTKKAHRSSFP